jgi:hypothetical protein
VERHERRPGGIAIFGETEQPPIGQVQDRAVMVAGNLRCAGVEGRQLSTAGGIQYNAALG